MKMLHIRTVWLNMVQNTVEFSNTFQNQNAGKTIKRRSLTLHHLAIGLVGLGLIWRMHRYALGIPIWGDEAFVAINFILRDFRGMIEPLVYGQICPLFFMWGNLAVTKVLGLSEWALSLPPFLAGIAGLLLFVYFARTALPRSAWLCAVGIFAGSYFIVRHSTEVKPYSIDLLVSLGLTMLGWSVVKKPASIGRWAALIALAAVAVWSSYPSMFVGGAVGILLTVQLVRSGYGAWSGTGLKPVSSKRLLIGWLLFGLVLCGAARFMYVVYAKPHAEHSERIFELESWQRTFPPVRQPWQLPVWFYEMHTGNMFAYPQGGSAPGSIGTFALFLLGCVRMWRTNRDLLLLLLAPFALTFVAAALEAYPYGGSARVAQHVAPAICILAGLGLSVLLNRFLHGIHRRRAYVITAGMLTIIPIGSMIETTLDPYKSDKNRRRHESVLWVVDQTIADGTGENDRWIVFNAIKPVEHAPYMGDWSGVGAEFLFNVMRFAPVPVEWSPPPNSIERKSGRRTWLLVFYARRESKVDFPDDQLEAYVRTMSARFGEPHHQSFLIRDERRAYESLELYRFDP